MKKLIPEKIFHSMRVKLILIFVLILIIPFATFGTITNERLKAFDIQTAGSNYLLHLKNITDTLDSDLNDLEYLSSNILVTAFTESGKSSSITSLINSLGAGDRDPINTEQSSTGEKPSDYSALNDILFYNASYSRVLNSIYLYVYSNGLLLSSAGNQRVFFAVNQENKNWVDANKSNFDRGVGWYLTEAINNNSSPGKYMVSYYIYLYNMDTEKADGLLLLNVSESTLYNRLRALDLKKDGTAFIVNSQGDVLAHYDRNLAGTNISGVSYMKSILNSTGNGSFTFSDGSIKYLCCYSTSAYTGWKIASILPVSQISSSFSIVKQNFILIYAFFFILMAILVLLISVWLYSPIQILFSKMSLFEKGDFSVKIIHHRKDEIGYIYERFNSMVANIQSYINDMFVQKLLQKEAYIKMILSQINEHFLYNTLNSIHWKAKQSGDEEVGRMIMSLSRFFRLNLNNGRDISTVQDIVNIIQCYIDIQQVRYKDKLLVNIHVDENVKQCKVLKYLFQPIVENAMNHGMEEKSGSCFIQISFTKKGNLLEFSVQDNGDGINTSKLAEIVQSLSLKDIETEGNFGLRNINSQLKLFYGDEYELSISSVEGIGKTVSFKIPIIN